MSERTVYLDHHAAAPLRPEAQAAMGTVMGHYANPASAHALGRAARAHIEKAREQVAEALASRPAKVVFTSGGTEACALALRALPHERLVIGPFEHSALRAECEAQGGRVLTSGELRHWLEGERPEWLREGTLVALGAVNHETGDIFPVEALATQARSAGASFFVDGTQALRKTPLSVGDASAVAVASHKMGGPAGAGALVLGSEEDITEPLVRGGGQERGRRAGTPDVRALVGFGAACAAMRSDEVGEAAAMKRVASHRDRLEKCLEDLGAELNAFDRARRVGTVTNVSVRDWPSALLVAALDLEGLCVSAGSACSSGVTSESPVIRALHPTESWRARSALRISLGPDGLDDADIEFAEAVLRRVIPRA